MMKRLRSAFITGFLVLVPLLATIHFLLWLIQGIDNNMRTFIPDIRPFNFGGAGILLVIVLILVTGLLTQNFVGKWLVSQFDHSLKNVPLVGGLYSSIKKFLETILSPSADQFHGTVLVEFPRKGA